ncbi:tripartite tricarboxylate transporter permease [Thermoanaerobacterium sp. DL9XJH110]|uniref:tripartite tricarboxylate transporter permease n=1 Tax=Thermoanaerobacterium sp. DL9XJH110 TaxID=3386643 RepID=UPI003BB4A9D6
MSTVSSLLSGLAAVMTPTNFIASIIGVLIGTLTGVLPGLGITGALALLLPASYGLSPATAMIMFCGVYYGAMYGGSTTSILVNIPGEGASVVTCIEGYEMAKKGRAGAALAVAAIGSFIAGTMGTIGLTFFAPMLAKAALAFGPPEYFAIAILGLVLLFNISGKSPLKSALMVMIGLMVSTIGFDPMTGVSRFTMGIINLEDGIEFIIFTMGLYGVGEILASICQPEKQGEMMKFKFRDLYPNREELKRSLPPMFRGGILGFLIGLMPGPGMTISTFVSYAVEKRLSKHPEEWGHGAIEGVAGPESANNAANAAQMVPLLSLGLPFNSSGALLLAGFMIHGVAPGPMLMSTNPDLFWAIIASLYVGNVLLLIINLPLVGVFASLLKIPIKILLPIVMVITFTGAYAINNSLFDLGLLLLFGILGFILKQAKFDLAPLVIGMFLGSTIEKGLVQGMIISNGSFMTLLSRPLAGTMLKIGLAVLLFSILRAIYRAIRARKAEVI